MGGWDQLAQAFEATLPTLDTDPAAHAQARAQLLQFGRALGKQPGAVRLLREHGEAFGMERRTGLSRVLADARPEQAMAGLMENAEETARARLREKEAERQRALKQEREQARLRPSPGFSPGW